MDPHRRIRRCRFRRQDADIIRSSKPDAQSEYARSIMPMPPGYEGGFEKEYVEALKTFVENGGIVMIPQ